MDGCTNYTVLSEADRAQGNAQPPYSKHDRGLVTGWYRFQGAAGDRMLDKCVPMNRCGTGHPGWLNGTHPTVTEGVVTRTVCYSYYDDCCLDRNFIKVKNCSSYYVYELPIPWASYFSRYCGNAGVGKLHWSVVLIANLNDWKYTMSLKYVDEPPGVSNITKSSQISMELNERPYRSFEFDNGI